MDSQDPDYEPWLYSHTPSQAEGESGDPEVRATQHPDVPRTEPSQAEGERGDEDESF
ncbi:hypothetical protein AB0D30_03260 [Streptomyces sp. NPDC048409]|uniref:hypothetical protein n=1 Tax=unclassified Streptomyces TaxID=2593676 RepID=UPI00332DB46C